MKVPNMFPKAEPPDGRVIAFVGEAPALEEISLGEPFVGPAGRELNRWLKVAGIIRSYCFFGNLSQVRAPNDKIENMYEDFKGQRPNAELRRWIQVLKEDLEKLQPSIIIALGRFPLITLTGQDRISKRWGSILPCSLVPGLKVVPLYHPSAILRGYSALRSIMTTFLRRAIKESKVKGLNLPERTYLINPSLEETLSHLQRLKASPTFAFDIERPEIKKSQTDSYITHISFSDNPSWAMSIPFHQGKFHKWAENHEALILRAIAELFQTDAIKIAHNLMFDYLCINHDWKMHIKPPLWDTMVAHNRCYPDLSNKTLKSLQLNSLAFCTALYTREPYYKDDYKSENQGGPTWKGSEYEFSLYNAKDSIVAYEIYEATRNDLQVFGLLEPFRADMEVFEVLAYMSLKGILRNEEKLHLLNSEVQVSIDELQERIDKEAGEALNISSPKQVANILYTKRGNRVQFNVDGRMTTDEAALAKLSRDSHDPLVPLIVTMRRWGKFKSTYLEATLSKDGRFRTTYNLGRASSNRISSSKSVLGGGGNLQNIPSRARPGEESYNKWIKELKETFIPDSGNLMGRRDYIQAEARVVAYMSDDEDLIKDFENNLDIHCRTAEQLFNIPYQTVLDEYLSGNPEMKMKRYFGKKTRHGFNYQMSKRRLKEEFWKEGIFIEEKQCGYMLAALAAANPKTVLWWKEVERNLYHDRTITNPLGGRRYFLGVITPEVLREAIAEGPQSTVARLLNLAIRKIWKELQTEMDPLLQIHDAFVWQCPEDKMVDVSQKIGELMNIPVEIKGRTLIIPSDLAIGPSWGELKEIK